MGYTTRASSPGSIYTILSTSPTHSLPYFLTYFLIWVPYLGTPMGPILWGVCTLVNHPPKGWFTELVPIPIRKSLTLDTQSHLWCLSGGLMNELTVREQQLLELGEALSDPLDFRTPQELADAIGISQSQILKLQSDPQFMAPVIGRFQRAAGAATVFIMKRLLKAVDEGNIQAARLGLEALKAVDTPGTSKTLVVAGTSGVRDDISQLPDDLLDAEIHRLLMETTPDDVEYTSGKVVPATYVEVESDLSGTEGEADEVAAGEAAPDG